MGGFDANDDRDGDGWSNLDEFLFERANQKSTFDGCGAVRYHPADIVTDVTEARSLAKYHRFSPVPAMPFTSWVVQTLFWKGSGFLRP